MPQYWTRQSLSHPMSCTQQYHMTDNKEVKADTLGTSLWNILPLYLVCNTCTLGKQLEWHISSGHRITILVSLSKINISPKTSEEQVGWGVVVEASLVVALFFFDENALLNFRRPRVMTAQQTHYSTHTSIEYILTRTQRAVYCVRNWEQHCMW